MSEKKDIQERVEELAAAHGWFVRRVAWGVGRRRAPDNVFSKKFGILNKTVWIEFKDRGKSARQDQLDEHKEMREAGMEVHVCDSVSAACKVLGIPFRRNPLKPHE